MKTALTAAADVTKKGLISWLNTVCILQILQKDGGTATTVQISFLQQCIFILLWLKTWYDTPLNVLRQKIQFLCSSACHTMLPLWEKPPLFTLCEVSAIMSEKHVE